MNKYIEFFNGYRHAYGVADFEHPDAYIDSETGKKKPVYRWNFEELTDEVYHLNIEVNYQLVYNHAQKTQKLSLVS